MARHRSQSRPSSDSTRIPSFTPSGRPRVCHPEGGTTEGSRARAGPTRDPSLRSGLRIAGRHMAPGPLGSSYGPARVTAPLDADVTGAMYLAKTPWVKFG